MARSVHPKEVSPLISGGIFSQRSRKTAEKQAPGYQEVTNDQQQLITDLVVAFTKSVDAAFKNADFLNEAPRNNAAEIETPRIGMVR